eukprot:TRINITY_DN649_c2_g2_i1.p1 TRINITY_DN649_c2_g2~~TRINITY_DN649_c2_g2_i1.p1  ORF type:complete len:355 (+),score=114.16 TRINITY_DN649_c2_g2_i1:63-1067(+)
MKSAMILLSMGVSLASAAANPLTSPSFFTSADCTGNADPKAALWSYAAKDKVAVKPFAKAGAVLSGYTVDTCLTDTTLTYSVKLTIDDAACPAKGDEALQLSYWKDSKTCEGTAEVTALKEGTCVKTPLGSAKFDTTLTADELCTVTDYIAAVKTGGVRTLGWAGDKCSTGTQTVNTLANMAEKQCGAEPECTGCCQAYDKTTCKASTGPSYEESLAACNKVTGGGWVGALAENGFSDATCKTEDNTAITSRLVQRFGTCATGTSGSTTLSTILEFVAPLTIDIHCQYVELNANKSVTGFLSWDDFNSRMNSAPAAHPVSALAILCLLCAVLLL